MPFRVGQRVWITCDVKPGMSPTEKTIPFVLPAPEEKIVSGFVPERIVRPRSNGLAARVAAVVASPPERGKGRGLLPGECLSSTHPVLVDESGLQTNRP